MFVIFLPTTTIRHCRCVYLVLKVLLCLISGYSPKPSWTRIWSFSWTSWLIIFFLYFSYVHQDIIILVLFFSILRILHDSKSSNWMTERQKFCWKRRSGGCYSYCWWLTSLYGRVSELSHEPRHGDVLNDAFVELFKKSDLSTSSVTSLHWKWDIQSMFPYSYKAKNL